VSLIWHKCMIVRLRACGGCVIVPSCHPSYSGSVEFIWYRDLDGWTIKGCCQ